MSAQDCVRPNSDQVAARVFDGEAILINVATGMYFSMDQVGATIWSLIESGLTTREIVDTVAAQFDVAPAQVAQDVAQLVQQLLDEHLVLPAEASAPRPAAGIAASGAKTAYTPPQLNIYRDMGELLALDPPSPTLQTNAWKDPFSAAAA